MLNEFKEFVMRGNVVDLAIGVIVGAAFGKIVDSLVSDVLMPPIGMLTGGIDFSNLQLVLSPEDPATQAVEEVAIRYGAFITNVIQFLIVAAVVFMVAKAVNKVRRSQPATPEAPNKTELLLTEIRDALNRKAP
jgi:large conductance mechanosensitive channel